MVLNGWEFSFWCCEQNNQMGLYNTRYRQGRSISISVCVCVWLSVLENLSPGLLLLLVRWIKLTFGVRTITLFHQTTPLHRHTQCFVSTVAVCGLLPHCHHRHSFHLHYQHEYFRRTNKRSLTHTQTPTHTRNANDVYVFVLCNSRYSFRCKLDVPLIKAMMAKFIEK